MLADEKNPYFAVDVLPLVQRQRLDVLEKKDVDILVISVTNLSDYKDYSPLGLCKSYGKACNSATSQGQKPPTVF